ncbi:MOS1T transposase, partial [Pseudoatta argentina]
MSKFVPYKVFLRGVLLHYFNMNKSAAEAHRILVDVYSEHALAEQTCRKWFARFKAGDISSNAISNNITRIIRYDEILIIYANQMCEKYRSQHHHNMIRARLRLLGRFLVVAIYNSEERLAEDFLKLLIIDIHKRDNYNKKINLPSLEDIKKIFLLFNKRRSGEMQRVLIADFQNYEKIHKDMNSEVYSSLLEKNRKIAEKYVRFCIRGKLGSSNHSENEVDKNSHDDRVNSNENTLSPYGKTKRTRWSQKEKEAAFHAFVTHMENFILPSLKEIEDVKKKYKAFATRISPQINSWLNNQQKAVHKSEVLC